MLKPLRRRPLADLIVDEALAGQSHSPLLRKPGDGRPVGELAFGDTLHIDTPDWDVRCSGFPLINWGWRHRLEVPLLAHMPGTSGGDSRQAGSTREWHHTYAACRASIEDGMQVVEGRL